MERVLAAGSILDQSRRKHVKKRLGETDVGLDIFQENSWFDLPSEQVNHQHELQQNWSTYIYRKRLRLTISTKHHAAGVTLCSGTFMQCMMQK